MCSSKKDLSQCCALYSATGIVVMSWVGVMLMKQPFFVGGIDDVEQATGSAFGAAALFFFIFIVSMVHLIMDSMTNSPSVVMMGPSDDAAGSLGAWAGQRRNEFEQVPVLQNYQDEPDGPAAERAGFLT